MASDNPLNDNIKAQRDVAVDVATARAVEREVAEEEAVRARVAAQQAHLEAERLRGDQAYLSTEIAETRRTASNNLFGIYLVLGILFAGLVVGGIYMFSRNRDVALANATDPNRSGIATGSAAVINNTPGGLHTVTVVPTGEHTNLFVVSGTPDYRTLIGKRVTFKITNIEDVIADRVFWIGSDPKNRLLAVLDRNLDDGIMEQIVKVKTGQLRTMSGIVEIMPDIKTARKRWKLDAGDVRDVQGQKLYVLIDRILLQ